MKSRMKTIIYTVIMVLAILAGSYVYAHVDKMQMVYDENIETAAYLSTGNLMEGSLQQSFVCKENSLDGVSVKCQLFGDVSEVEIEYQLFEEGSDEAVAKGEMKAAEMKNNQLSKLFFDDKVMDSRGKKYTLCIEEENASKENGVGFYYQNKQEKGSKLIVGEEEKEGTLIVKTITKRFDVETFIMVVSFVLFIWGFFKVLYKLFK